MLLERQLVDLAADLLVLELNIILLNY